MLDPEAERERRLMARAGAGGREKWERKGMPTPPRSPHQLRKIPPRL